MHALEKEMATRSSVLAWDIPWIEEPGGLQFLELGCKESEDRGRQLLLLLSRFSCVRLCVTP